MNKNAVLRLLKYISKYKASAIMSIVSAFIVVLSSLFGPFLTGKAIDQMFLGSTNFKNILNILFLLAFVYILGVVFQWLLGYFTIFIANETSKNLRQELFLKLNSVKLSFFDKTPHGDTISRFINDIDAITDGVSQGTSQLLSGILTIIGLIAIMLYISPLMTLVIVLSAPLSYYVAKFITTHSQKMFQEQASTLGALNGYIEEMISGQKVVKAFCYEENSIREFEKINQRLYKVGLKAQFYSAMNNPSIRYVNNITYTAIAIIGGVFAMLGKISIGDISVFIIYSALFAKPFNDITSVINLIQSAIASAERVFAIIDKEPQAPDSTSSVKLEKVKGNILFKDVCFSYSPDKPLITNFNLKVKSGKKIAIVGHTGAGKTTLVNLLMRFYDVDSGEIFVDGINIKDAKRDYLRRSFGIVLQDTWLFDGTIRDNISYAKLKATDEEIVNAAKQAGANSFIKRLENGYDTVINGAGKNLSEGEKQLLTIARVMLLDPPILILDEATSNIDTRTEISVQKAFMKMLQGRTSFVIAHRLSTIKEADLILLLDNGNIIESGTHSQLLKLGKAYSNLYHSQFAHQE